MKGLTLHQPWASFMAWGLKRIETRSWAPPASLYGQWVAIHAGKNRDSLDDVHLLLDAARATFDDPGEAFRVVPERYDIMELPRGAVVAVGRLLAVFRTEVLAPGELGTDRPLGNYEPGRFGWRFDPVIACPVPIACRGYQQLWDVPAEVEAPLLALIEERRAADAAMLAQVKADAARLEGRWAL